MLGQREAQGLDRGHSGAPGERGPSLFKAGSEDRRGLPGKARRQGAPGEVQSCEGGQRGSGRQTFSLGQQGPPEEGKQQRGVGLPEGLGGPEQGVSGSRGQADALAPSCMQKK